MSKPPTLWVAIRARRRRGRSPLPRSTRHDPSRDRRRGRDAGHVDTEPGFAAQVERSHSMRYEFPDIDAAPLSIEGDAMISPDGLAVVQGLERPWLLPLGREGGCRRREVRRAEVRVHVVEDDGGLPHGRSGETSPSPPAEAAMSRPSSRRRLMTVSLIWLRIHGPFSRGSVVWLDGLRHPTDPRSNPGPYAALGQFATTDPRALNIFSYGPAARPTAGRPRPVTGLGSPPLGVARSIRRYRCR